MKTYYLCSVPIVAQFFLIVAFTLSISGLHSQNYTPRFECTNYNTFLRGDSIQALNYLAENIYPTELFTLKLFSPTLGISSQREFLVKLIDCQNDDSDCFEYYNDIGGLQASNTNIQQLQIKAQNNEIEVREIETVRVFDYTGRVLFEGSINSFNEYRVQLQNQLIFASYYDKSGQIIHSKKEFITN